jgi:hypothetical protein
MAYTATELDVIIAKLESRLSQGTAEVQFSDGKRVRYSSTTEILAAINYYKGLKDAISPTRIRQFRGYTTQGL